MISFLFLALFYVSFYREYNNYLEGEFVLYQHKELPFEVLNVTLGCKNYELCALQTFRLFNFLVADSRRLSEMRQDDRCVL